MWGEAVSTFVYVLSRSATKRLAGLTPYEKWTGRKPNASHLRVFGSLAYVKNITGHLKKLDDRSIPMIFIGYEIGIKAYQSFDPTTLKVNTSRDIIFEENINLKRDEMKENPLKTVFPSKPELFIDFGDGKGASEVSACERNDNTFTDFVDQVNFLKFLIIKE